MPTYERGKHFVLSDDYSVLITKRRNKYEWAAYKGLDYRNVLAAGEANTPAKAKSDALRALNESLAYLQRAGRDPQRRPPSFRRNAPVMVWVNPDASRYTVAIQGYRGWRIYQIHPYGYDHIETLSAFTPRPEWGYRIALKDVIRRVRQFIDREKSDSTRWTSDW